MPIWRVSPTWTAFRALNMMETRQIEFRPLQAENGSIDFLLLPRDLSACSQADLTTRTPG